MKIHCRNGCGRSVRNPRAKSWEEEGVCPHCYTGRDYSNSAEPRLGGGDLKRPDMEIIMKKGTPVDYYWHILTVREVLSIDDY